MTDRRITHPHPIQEMDPQGSWDPGHSTGRDLPDHQSSDGYRWGHRGPERAKAWPEVAQEVTCRALPLTCCVTLGSSLPISELPFPSSNGKSAAAT